MYRSILKKSSSYVADVDTSSPRSGTFYENRDPSYMSPTSYSVNVLPACDSGASQWVDGNAISTTSSVSENFLYVDARSSTNTPVFSTSSRSFPPHMPVQREKPGHCVNSELLAEALKAKTKLGLMTDPVESTSGSKALEALRCYGSDIRSSPPRLSSSSFFDSNYLYRTHCVASTAVSSSYSDVLTSSGAENISCEEDSKPLKSILKKAVDNASNTSSAGTVVTSTSVPLLFDNIDDEDEFLYGEEMQNSSKVLDENLSSVVSSIQCDKQEDVLLSTGRYNKHMEKSHDTDTEQFPTAHGNASSLKLHTPVSKACSEWEEPDEAFEERKYRSRPGSYKKEKELYKLDIFEHSPPEMCKESTKSTKTGESISEEEFSKGVSSSKVSFHIQRPVAQKKRETAVEEKVLSAEVGRSASPSASVVSSVPLPRKTPSQPSKIIVTTKAIHRSQNQPTGVDNQHPEDCCEPSSALGLVPHPLRRSTSDKKSAAKGKINASDILPLQTESGKKSLKMSDVFFRDGDDESADSGSENMSSDKRSKAYESEGRRGKHQLPSAKVRIREIMREVLAKNSSAEKTRIAKEQKRYTSMEEYEAPTSRGAHKGNVSNKSIYSKSSIISEEEYSRDFVKRQRHHSPDYYSGSRKVYSDSSREHNMNEHYQKDSKQRYPGPSQNKSYGTVSPVHYSRREVLEADFYERKQRKLGSHKESIEKGFSEWKRRKTELPSSYSKDSRDRSPSGQDKSPNKDPYCRTASKYYRYRSPDSDHEKSLRKKDYNVSRYCHDRRYDNSRGSSSPKRGSKMYSSSHLEKEGTPRHSRRDSFEMAGSNRHPLRGSVERSSSYSRDRSISSDERKARSHKMAEMKYSRERSSSSEYFKKSPQRSSSVDSRDNTPIYESASQNSPDVLSEVSTSVQSKRLLEEKMNIKVDAEDGKGAKENACNVGPKFSCADSDLKNWKSDEIIDKEEKGRSSFVRVEMPNETPASSSESGEKQVRSQKDELSEFFRRLEEKKRIYDTTMKESSGAGIKALLPHSQPQAQDQTIPSFSAASVSSQPQARTFAEVQSYVSDLLYVGSAMQHFPTSTTYSDPVYVPHSATYARNVPPYNPYYPPPQQQQHYYQTASSYYHGPPSVPQAVTVGVPAPIAPLQDMSVRHLAPDISFPEVIRCTSKFQKKTGPRTCMLKEIPVVTASEVVCSNVLPTDTSSGKSSEQTSEATKVDENAGTAENSTQSTPSSVSGEQVLHFSRHKSNSDNPISGVLSSDKAQSIDDGKRKQLKHKLPSPPTENLCQSEAKSASPERKKGVPKDKNENTVPTKQSCDLEAYTRLISLQADIDSEINDVKREISRLKKVHSVTPQDSRHGKRRIRQRLKKERSRFHQLTAKADKISKDISEMKKKLNSPQKDVGTRPTEVKPEDKQKTAKEEKKKKPPLVEIRHFFFDEGNHWCQVCNEVFTTILQKLMHLKSDKHKLLMGTHERAWSPPPKEDSFNIRGPRVLKKRMPVKGTEFISPVEGYFCSLCKVCFPDDLHVIHHLKTYEHYDKYQKYVEMNTEYEKKYKEMMNAGLTILEIERKRKMVEEAASLAKKRKGKEESENKAGDGVEVKNEAMTDGKLKGKTVTLHFSGVKKKMLSDRMDSTSSKPEQKPAFIGKAPNYLSRLAAKSDKTKKGGFLKKDEPVTGDVGIQPLHQTVTNSVNTSVESKVSRTSECVSVPEDQSAAPSQQVIEDLVEKVPDKPNSPVDGNSKGSIQNTVGEKYLEKENQHNEKTASSHGSSREILDEGVKTLNITNILPLPRISVNPAPEVTNPDEAFPAEGKGTVNLCTSHSVSERNIATVSMPSESSTIEAKQANSVCGPKAVVNKTEFMDASDATVPVSEIDLPPSSLVGASKRSHNTAKSKRKVSKASLSAHVGEKALTVYGPLTEEEQERKLLGVSGSDMCGIPVCQSGVMLSQDQHLSFSPSFSSSAESNLAATFSGNISHQVNASIFPCQPYSMLKPALPPFPPPLQVPPPPIGIIPPVISVHSGADSQGSTTSPISPTLRALRMPAPEKKNIGRGKMINIHQSTVDHQSVSLSFSQKNVALLKPVLYSEGRFSEKPNKSKAEKDVSDYSTSSTDNLLPFQKMDNSTKHLNQEMEVEYICSTPQSNNSTARKASAKKGYDCDESKNTSEKSKEYTVEKELSGAVSTSVNDDLLSPPKTDSSTELTEHPIQEIEIEHIGTCPPVQSDDSTPPKPGADEQECASNKNGSNSEKSEECPVQKESSGAVSTPVNDDLLSPPKTDNSTEVTKHLIQEIEIEHISTCPPVQSYDSTPPKPGADKQECASNKNGSTSEKSEECTVEKELSGALSTPVNDDLLSPPKTDSSTELTEHPIQEIEIEHIGTCPPVQSDDSTSPKPGADEQECASNKNGSNSEKSEECPVQKELSGALSTPVSDLLSPPRPDNSTEVTKHLIQEIEIEHISTCPPVQSDDSTPIKPGADKQECASNKNGSTSEKSEECTVEKELSGALSTPVNDDLLSPPKTDNSTEVTKHLIQEIEIEHISTCPPVQSDDSTPPKPGADKQECASNKNGSTSEKSEECTVEKELSGAVSTPVNDDLLSPPKIDSSTEVTKHLIQEIEIEHVSTCPPVQSDDSTELKPSGNIQACTFNESEGTSEESKKCILIADFNASCNDVLLSPQKDVDQTVLESSKLANRGIEIKNVGAYQASQCVSSVISRASENVSEYAVNEGKESIEPISSNSCDSSNEPAPILNSDSAYFLSEQCEGEQTINDTETLSEALKTPSGSQNYNSEENLTETIECRLPCSISCFSDCTDEIKCANEMRITEKAVNSENENIHPDVKIASNVPGSENVAVYSQRNQREKIIVASGTVSSKASNERSCSEFVPCVHSSINTSVSDLCSSRSDQAVLHVDGSKNCNSTSDHITEDHECKIVPFSSTEQTCLVSAGMRIANTELLEIKQNSSNNGPQNLESSSGCYQQNPSVTSSSTKPNLEMSGNECLSIALPLNVAVCGNQAEQKQDMKSCLVDGEGRSAGLLHLSSSSEGHFSTSQSDKSIVPQVTSDNEVFRTELNFDTELFSVCPEDVASDIPSTECTKSLKSPEDHGNHVCECMPEHSEAENEGNLNKSVPVPADLEVISVCEFTGTHKFGSTEMPQESSHLVAGSSAGIGENAGEVSIALEPGSDIKSTISVSETPQHASAVNEKMSCIGQIGYSEGEKMELEESKGPAGEFEVSVDSSQGNNNWISRKLSLSTGSVHSQSYRCDSKHGIPEIDDGVKPDTEHGDHKGCLQPVSSIHLGVVSTEENIFSLPKEKVEITDKDSNQGSVQNSSTSNYQQCVSPGCDVELSRGLSCDESVTSSVDSFQVDQGNCDKVESGVIHHSTASKIPPLLIRRCKLPAKKRKRKPLTRRKKSSRPLFLKQVAREDETATSDSIVSSELKQELNNNEDTDEYECVQE